MSKFAVAPWTFFDAVFSLIELVSVFQGDNERHTEGLAERSEAVRSRPVRCGRCAPCEYKQRAVR